MKSVNSGTIRAIVISMALSSLAAAPGFAQPKQTDKAVPVVKSSGKTTPSATTKTSLAKSKPKILPWSAFSSEKDEDDERTYNIFKYKMTTPSIDTSDPKNWRTFDPASFANKLNLVPELGAVNGMGPVKYGSSDFPLPQNPAESGANSNGSNKVVFAHQGTPMQNGWIAPQAGYAYQVDGVLVYGTTNYTPINYHGEMSKHIGIDRVPVEILSASGAKEKLDLSRLVFPVNDNLLSRPHNKVYPSVIYLKPGEKATIQGFGTVNCPRPNAPEQVSIATLNGDLSIKVYCVPDKPIIPGEITP